MVNLRSGNGFYPIPFILANNVPINYFFINSRLCFLWDVWSGMADTLGQLLTYLLIANESLLLSHCRVIKSVLGDFVAN